jgi:hypothetical protein
VAATGVLGLALAGGMLGSRAAAAAATAPSRPGPCVGCACRPQGGTCAR